MDRARRIAAWSVALLSIALLAVATPARTGADGRAELAAARAVAHAAARDAAMLDHAADAAIGEAARTRAELVALGAHVRVAEADLRAADLRLATIARAERAQALRLAARRAPLARLTATLQRIARRPPALALAAPRSIDDATYVHALIATLLPAIEARTAELRRTMAALAALRRAAAVARADVSRRTATLAAQRALLADARRVAEARALAARDDAERAHRRMAGLAERADDIARLVAGFDHDAAVNARLGRLPGPLPRPGTHGRPASPIGDPVYRLPASGAVVAGTGEVSASGIRQRGLTLAVAPGALAIAPAAGQVVYAGRFGRYGAIVILNHGHGWTTVLAGLGMVSVVAGAPIGGGAPIGRMGAGRPRLTIELRHHGRPVDVATLAARAAG